MPIEKKVGHWLSQQHELPSGEHDQTLKLVTTWGLIHVNTVGGKMYLGNRFSISESEVIGINCKENPSLSVMYPNTNEAAVILSHSKLYWSATFLNISGKEYLVAVSLEDGFLYLWDIESKTSKKVFDPNIFQNQQHKNMNICKLRDNTIGYGEARASPDGSRRVFILKMDTEKMTLSSMLRLFTPHDIWDMCYTEVDGGTPCLLLCVSWRWR